MTEKSHEHRDHDRRHHIAHIRARVEESGCERPLALGKPLCHRLDAGGKVGGLAQTEQKHGQRKTGDRKRRARQHGCDAPQSDGDRERLARAQLVGQTTRDQHRDAVSQLERDCDDPVLVVVQARDNAFERVFEIGDHGAVDIGDDRGEKQKRANHPALIGHSVRGRRGDK